MGFGVYQDVMRFDVSMSDRESTQIVDGLEHLEAVDFQQIWRNVLASSDK
jgi:hypothetical protein